MQTKSTPPPSAPARQKIAVIGAGIAGLAAASALVQRGHEVVVFDKGRGVGGRTATRRLVAEGIYFDLGAPAFEVTTPAFADVVAGWESLGIVARSPPSAAAAGLAPISAPPRFVGVPRMRAIAESMASPLCVQTGAEVAGLVREPSGYALRFAETQDAAQDEANRVAAAGPAVGFQGVVLTAPPEQSAALLRPLHTPLLDSVLAVSSQARLAVGLAYAEEVRVNLDRRSFDGPLLQNVTCENAKPGRRFGPTCFTLHSSPLAPIPRDADAVQRLTQRMIAAWEQVLLDDGITPPAVVAMTHQHWRLAEAANPSHAEALFDPHANLAVAGDWLHGGGVEGAYLSGLRAAGYF